MKVKKVTSWFEVLHSEGKTRKGKFSLAIQNQPGNANKESQIPLKPYASGSMVFLSMFLFVHLSDTAPVFPKLDHLQFLVALAWPFVTPIGIVEDHKCYWPRRYSEGSAENLPE